MELEGKIQSERRQKEKKKTCKLNRILKTTVQNKIVIKYRSISNYIEIIQKVKLFT